MSEDKAEIRKLRKHLRDLTITVRQGINALDAEMKTPSTAERGARIAAICNTLDMQNDIALHFGLGKPLGWGK